MFKPTMPAGKYYVGDLCYVMHNEWDEVCSLIIDGHNCKEGVFTLANGTRFAIYNTADGDGVYDDNMGNEYGVDAGSIGCILVSDCTEEIDERLGHIVDFDTDFEVRSYKGDMYFGHIHIDTAYFEDPDEDEDTADEYNDEQEEDDLLSTD